MAAWLQAGDSASGAYRQGVLRQPESVVCIRFWTLHLLVLGCAWGSVFGLLRKERRGYESTSQVHARIAAILRKGPKRWIAYLREEIRWVSGRGRGIFVVVNSHAIAACRLDCWHFTMRFRQIVDGRGNSMGLILGARSSTFPGSVTGIPWGCRVCCVEAARLVQCKRVQVMKKAIESSTEIVAWPSLHWALVQVTL
nr:hypothetical protein CFP56_16625 [Quercus suber]